MKSKFEYDVETLRIVLHASVDALDVMEKEREGLTLYSIGRRDAFEEVIQRLDMILEEVNKE